MANTTEIMIVCLDEDDVIKSISEKTSVRFLEVSDGRKCGGSHVLTLSSYGACERSLGRQKIDEVIAAFKEGEFLYPELAVMIIDDDNEVFNGVVVREGNQ